MSYSIRYGQDIRQETQMKKRLAGKYLGAIFLTAAILAGIFWPEMRETVHQILFPWINDASAAAFSDMIASIGAGTAVPVAVADFCRELISHAGIPV